MEITHDMKYLAEHPEAMKSVFTVYLAGVSFGS